MQKRVVKQEKKLNYTKNKNLNVQFKIASYFLAVSKNPLKIPESRYYFYNKQSRTLQRVTYAGATRI